MSGRCLEVHEAAARSLEVQIQRLNVEVLEFGQRGIGGQFELQPANGFTADDHADVVESGLQRRLEILAITSGPNRELCGNGGRRDVRAGQRLPVGGFQPVDRQLEGGVRNSLTRLGPGQGHRLIETAVDESAPGLGDRQPERFQFGRLFGLIHGGAVLGDNLELRGLVAGRCHEAHVADRDAALRGHHRALLEQVDTPVGTDGRASEIVGEHRGGDLQYAAIDAGDLVADLSFLLGRIKGPTQHHGSEGLPALLERQFELAQFTRRAVHGEGGGKSAGILE